ncbi:hypothetical protein LSH36_1743g00009 [Paralvinella palmiformis]|uniref:Uncharacterized protein n=1 Tax=Paralvinella palmiformis TaxID=53620 RepID=A0AAD9MPK1_9ANNE|nr:hypothetical protein LSH36_1743g00009 [Paralvinella palmiformis]
MNRSRATLEKTQLQTYSGSLIQQMNHLSKKIFGGKMLPDFIHPGTFTGELIGIEYLFHQTGDSLSVGPDTEAAEMSDEAVMVMMAKNDIADFEDQTVPDVVESLLSTVTLPIVPSDTQLPTPGPSPSTSTTKTPPAALPRPALPLSQDKEQSVGPDNVPGFRAVERLAQYLVDLRKEAGISLSNQQANTIVRLWEDPDIYDQSRIMYSNRYQRTPKEAGQALTQHMRGKSNKTGQGVTVLSNSQVAAQATNIFIFPTASSTSSSAEISKEYVPSRTTVYRQRKRLQEGTTKAVHKHPSVPYTCSKCTQDRTAATGALWL